MTRDSNIPPSPVDEWMDRWIMPWYGAYPTTFAYAAFLYVIWFLFALLPVYAGWTTLDTFNDVALIMGKYSAALAGIIGSLWALVDYFKQ